MLRNESLESWLKPLLIQGVLTLSFTENEFAVTISLENPKVKIFSILLLAWSGYLEKNIPVFFMEAIVLASTVLVADWWSEHAGSGINV